MAAIVTNSYFRNVTGKPGLLAFGAMATLALYILAWAYPTFPGDEWILVGIQSFRSGWLDETAKWFASFGLFWVFMPSAGVLMVSLLLLRRYADVSMLFVSLMIIGAVNALKLIVDRPRPDHQIFEPVESSLSFPSGHSLLAVILGGVLIYLVGLWVKPILARRIIQAALILVIIGMGMSRVYMGVHWPSDVIGSYMSGLLALVALIGLRNAVASDP